MKKKLLSLALALALCLGLAVPAFAEDAGDSPEAYPYLVAPKEFGIGYQMQAIGLQFIGFGRSGSDNEHIFYNTYEDYEDGLASLVPAGVDIVVTGAESAEDVTLYAYSAIDMEEGVWEHPAGTYLFYRLFAWETGEDLSLVPLDMDDPMEFAYDDPMDGENHVAGNITAAAAGFQANEDGDVVLSSGRLYELLDVGDLLRVQVDGNFWMYRLTGEPALIAEEAPANSGIIAQTETMDLHFVNFARSGNDNARISYGICVDGGSGKDVRLAPKGVDIVVPGVASADEIMLRAFSAAELKEGPFQDLPGGTYLFCRLLTWESGKDISLVPLDTDDPMEFAYDDPNDGKTHVAGNITAADAGFQANKDGDVVLDSERIYDLLDEGGLLQVTVGGISWMYQLSGEPLLISDVFEDVDAGSWLSDPIAWAWEKGIATGTSETRFSPDNDCTHAQILTFLYRAAREEQAESTAEDMALAEEWARENGMIDESFAASEPCTRAAAVRYIWQAFGEPSAEASSFADMDAYSEDYLKAVDWAKEMDITDGVGGGKFGPDNICSRAQIATFLYRAYTNE